MKYLSPIPVTTETIRRIRDDSRTAVLLIHGLSGNPFEVGLMADYLFKQRGYSVVAPLLSGHYDPALPLRRARHTVWIEQVRREYRDLAALHKQVCIIGHSMGTLLTLMLAHDFPATTPAIALIAPPVFIDSRAAEWAIRILRRRGIDFGRLGIPGDPKQLKDVGVREVMPKAKFIPFNAVMELAELRDRALAPLGELTVPTFAIFSKKDKTVSMRGLNYLDSHITKAPFSSLILEKSSHIIPLDIERETVFEAIGSFFERHST